MIHRYFHHKQHHEWNTSKKKPYTSRYIGLWQRRQNMNYQGRNLAFISYKYAPYPSYKCIFRNIAFKSNTTKRIYDHGLTHICFLMIIDWYSQFRIFIAIYVLGNILDTIKIDQFSNALNLTLKVKYTWAECAA